MKFELAKELKEAGYPQAAINFGDFYCGLCEQEGKQDEMSSPTCDCHEKERKRLSLADNTTWGEYLAKWERAQITVPTLSELIAACGDDGPFILMTGTDPQWKATDLIKTELGDTPEEAVARLWIALQKDQT